MLDIVYSYQNILENIDTHIEASKFKKEYLIEQLGISRASFYNKVKKKTFSVAEMVTLSTALFPEEAKAIAIRESLKRSKEDSDAGRIKENVDVLADARKKLLK